MPSRRRGGRVGVIGTEATIASGAYIDAFAAAPQVTVHSQACPRFVELVEAGVTSGDEAIAVAREYLAALQESEVDTPRAGCTHYPLLTGVLAYVMGTTSPGVERGRNSERRLSGARGRGLFCAARAKGHRPMSFSSPAIRMRSKTRSPVPRSGNRAR